MAWQSSFTIDLDLPDIRIISTSLAREQDLIIEVESTLTTVACDQCGRLISDFDGYDPAHKLRYLSPGGRILYVSFRPKRFRCPYCENHPVTLQQLKRITS
jgi:transposase